MIHPPKSSSVMARYIQCPGWYQQSIDIPRQGSIFAAEGTAMHHVYEQCVLRILHPRHFLGLTVEGVQITQTHVDKLDRALHYTRHYLDQADCVATEVFGQYAKDTGGTGDLYFKIGTTLYCADLKTGDGHIVKAFQNPQLMFNAVCARRQSSISNWFKDVDKIVLMIIQPSDRLDEPVDTYEMDVDELDQFEKQMKVTLAEADQPNARLATGPECQYCPAAPICPKKTGAAHRALLMDPTQLEDLAEALDLAAELEGWAEQVRKTALEQMDQGSRIEGYKMVSKRPVARWTDPEDVIKRFRYALGGKANMLAPFKLKTPLQMEKLAKSLGRDIDFSEYVIKKSSGNVVASVDDPREEVLPLAALANLP
jgi:hypothetical protein